MNAEQIKSVYFVGIGGIGMSAIARYFISRGVVVAGYDRTPSDLTEQLRKEGALVHYEDNVDLIPASCREKASTLVVYTPAIPAEHTELTFFRNNGYEIQKRAQVLGTLTRALKGLCVAGTHGKTTTSSMAAHLLHQSHVDCNAFLGGITKNYGTNYILSQKSPFVVIEADEFDRSFHHLTPYASVITATDADHLDIYGTEEAYLESFSKYSSLILPGGYLIMHTGLKMKPAVQGASPSIPIAARVAISMRRMSASGMAASPSTSFRPLGAFRASSLVCLSASTLRTALPLWRWPRLPVPRRTRYAAGWLRSAVWTAVSTSM